MQSPRICPYFEVKESDPLRLERLALQTEGILPDWQRSWRCSNRGSEAALPRRVVLLGQDPGFKERIVICGGSRASACGRGTVPSWRVNCSTRPGRGLSGVPSGRSFQEGLLRRRSQMCWIRFALGSRHRQLTCVRVRRVPPLSVPEYSTGGRLETSLALLPVRRPEHQVFL